MLNLSTIGSNHFCSSSGSIAGKTNTSPQYDSILQMELLALLGLARQRSNALSKLAAIACLSAGLLCKFSTALINFFRSAGGNSRTPIQ